MFNVEMEFGMNPIDTQWNGMSMAYETDVRDFCYNVDCNVNREYEKEVILPIEGPSVMPTGLPAQDERYVVPLHGQDCQYDLPPYKNIKLVQMDYVDQCLTSRIHT